MLNSYLRKDVKYTEYSRNEQVLGDENLQLQSYNLVHNLLEVF